LLCALAGCLNPRPDDYPSEADAPNASRTTGPAAETPGFDGASAEGAPNSAPADEAAPESPPQPEQPSRLVPPEPPDAGVEGDAQADAGPGDAGVPALAD